MIGGTIVHTYVLLSLRVVDKQMSVFTFEGLPTTFQASTNVFLLTSVIKLYIIIVITHALELPEKCFLLIIKLLGTHVAVLCSS